MARLAQQMTGHRSEYDARNAGDLASWDEASALIYNSDFDIYDSSRSANPTVEEIIGKVKEAHEALERWAISVLDGVEEQVGLRLMAC